MHLDRLLERQGGVANAASLARAGVGRSHVRTLVARGALTRIRVGWFATPTASPELIAAVALGGRLGCISATSWHGLWTPENDGRNHVAIPRHAGRTYGDLTSVAAHWLEPPWREHASPISTVSSVIRHAVECCDRENAIAVIDSALNTRALSMTSVERVLSAIPLRARGMLDEIDGASQSGLESLCRLRLGRLGQRIQSQVLIDGVGHVDLLLGDRLVIETDGREWHEGTESFRADRSRDLGLVARGFSVMRLGYSHVMRDWPLVELAVRGLIARGEHVWSSRQRRAGFGINHRGG